MSVIPRMAEVSNGDPIVMCSLPLQPQQKALLGFDGAFTDVTDGETRDEGPDQAENDFLIPVNDVFSPDVVNLDALGTNEVEAHVDIFKFLHSKLGCCRIATERLFRQDLENVDQGDLLRWHVSDFALVPYNLGKCHE